MVRSILILSVLLAGCEPDRLAFCAKYASIAQDFAACSQFDEDCAWNVRMARSNLRRYQCDAIQVRE